MRLVFIDTPEMVRVLNKIKLLIIQSTPVNVVVHIINKHLPIHDPIYGKYNVVFVYMITVVQM